MKYQLMTGAYDDRKQQLIAAAFTLLLAAGLPIMTSLLTIDTSVPSHTGTTLGVATGQTETGNGPGGSTPPADSQSSTPKPGQSSAGAQSQTSRHTATVTPGSTSTSVYTIRPAAYTVPSSPAAGGSGGDSAPAVTGQDCQPAAGSTQSSGDTSNSGDTGGITDTSGGGSDGGRDTTTQPTFSATVGPVQTQVYATDPTASTVQINGL
jgi:hypothetical protein